MTCILDDMAKDWAVDQAARIGGEIRRLRGSRSGQWLSDRTHELGYRVPRTTISELENGKRKYVSTAELAILARALDTAPITLLYPPPYGAEVEILPGETSTNWVAVEWFSGRTARYGDIDDMSTYERNLAPLRAAVKIADLKRRRMRLTATLANVDDEAMRVMLLDEVNEIQSEIDELSGDAG